MYGICYLLSTGISIAERAWAGKSFASAKVKTIGETRCMLMLSFGSTLFDWFSILALEFLLSNALLPYP